MSERIPDATVRLGQLMERTIALGSWLMAPVYVGLTVMLGLITVKFVQQLLAAIPGILRTPDSSLILTALSLTDLSLVGNLLMVVALAGYSGFIARIMGIPVSKHVEAMGSFELGNIKLKLVGAIVAISSIRLLESFIYPGQRTDRAIFWQVVIQFVIVLSGLLLALMDRISVAADGAENRL